jgi:beta-lactam-binding protein with PASTA domain
MNIFRLLSLALVLIIVALVSAFTTMRLAIHTREVTVPKFIGLTPGEADQLAAANGLTFEVERRFYSPQIAPGRIVSQMPEVGATVRRGWQVRGAESLGPQRVSIPNVIGQSSRAAEINLRERGLELGQQAMAHIPDAIPDQVVGQDPPADAHEVSTPKIGILIAAPTDPPAFLMPDFTGQPLAVVSHDIEQAGLHVGKVTMRAPVNSGTPPNDAPPAQPAPSAAAQAAPSSTSTTLIVSQSPAPGEKVTAGTVVNFEVNK